ncbi:hypothetical protein [Synechococcus sp. MIT S1220]
MPQCLKRFPQQHSTDQQHQKRIGDRYQSRKWRQDSNQQIDVTAAV